MSTDRQTEVSRHDACILIVDDEPANMLLLQSILTGAGYNRLLSAWDGQEAIQKILEDKPDLVLLDLLMPVCDGYQVLEQLEEHFAEQHLPVLVLTADITSRAKRRSLRSGAKDFLIKPFDSVEVLLRVRNLLETRFLTLELQNQNRDLEERVAQRTAEVTEAYEKQVLFNAQLRESQRAVEESQIEVLHRLAQAAELRDDDTGQHTHRVGELAARLAQQLQLEKSKVELIRLAAPLHDVGKIGVSDTILLKPGRLTPEEFETMKKHAVIGGALLAAGQSAFVRTAEIIALSHHERYDGSGYPNGLAGEDIPIEGRILAIVDVFDALTHERPYKSAWSVEEAIAEIKNQSGKHFDPRVVSAFLEIVEPPATAS
jgi:putative two-component system response regulator